MQRIDTREMESHHVVRSSSSFGPSQIAEQDVIRISAFAPLLLFPSIPPSLRPLSYSICSRAACSELPRNALVTPAQLELGLGLSLQSSAKLNAPAPQSPLRLGDTSPCTATHRQRRSFTRSMASRRMFSGMAVVVSVGAQWREN